MTEFQILTDYSNLYSSFLKSMKGKGKKKGAMKFNAMALEQIYVMKQQLCQRTYVVSPYNQFVISEPKKRVIMSGAFRDKVLQHCLCDYVLLPRMQKHFIKDNYAGQIGKGTLFGLNRLSENLSEFIKTHDSGFVLKCDISKFFYSIDHDKMKSVLRMYFDDDDILWVCDLFIDSTEGVGLPLGNQCSQVFALIYLNELDHYITEELGCKLYGRYTDDFYLISDSKEYLQDCLNKIAEFLNKYKLTLNGKTQIFSLKQGIKFLGFHTYVAPDKQVIRKLTGANKQQIKRRLRKYAKLVADGKMSKKEFFERYDSWKNHASKGNCYKLTSSMDKFVNNILE